MGISKTYIAVPSSILTKNKPYVLIFSIDSSKKNVPVQAFGHLAVQVAAPAKAVEAAGFEAAETFEFEVIDMMVELE